MEGEFEMTETLTMSEVVAQARFETLGKLVKTWATGEDYVRIGGVADPARFPKPQNGGKAELEKLQRQFDLAGVNLRIEGRFSKLVVVQEGAETLVLRLPPAESIKRQEQHLEQPGAAYPLPSFYEDAITVTGNQSLDTVEDRLAFELKRIGDYTISNCCG